MSPLVIPLLEIGSKVFEKVFPDPAKADEAKLKLLEMSQNGELQELAARANIVKAEAESENWLVSSWRPILMLTFGGLIVARWFGWAAPNLSEAEYIQLWNIVELGIGGYVVGRTAEKIVPSIAGALKK